MKAIQWVLLIAVAVAAGWSAIEDARRGVDSRQAQLISGATQGTTYRVTVASSHWDVEKSKVAIEAELSRLDAVLSNYRNDSVIERFNSMRSLDAVQVGPEIVNLVRVARTVGAAAHGCYDVTIKPLYDAWGFAGERLTPPSDGEIRRLRSITGDDLIRAPTGTKLAKRVEDLQIDLSSIGQGYSIARVAAVLDALGEQDYLVEIGGELLSRGSKADGRPWRVAIERPFSGQRSLQKLVTIEAREGLAIMTSGTYRHYFDDHGKRYSHILDARTGTPITHETVSVTVLHGDPIQADAWSTALLCLGRKAGVRVAEEHGVAALFIEDIDSSLAEHATRAWLDMKSVKVQ